MPLTNYQTHHGKTQTFLFVTESGPHPVNPIGNGNFLWVYTHYDRATSILFASFKFYLVTQTPRHGSVIKDTSEKRVLRVSKAGLSDSQ
jgi:hypothetical protein